MQTSFGVRISYHKVFAIHKAGEQQSEIRGRVEGPEHLFDHNPGHWLGGMDFEEPEVFLRYDFTMLTELDSIALIISPVRRTSRNLRKYTTYISN
jgi:hypothetical protein